MKSFLSHNWYKLMIASSFLIFSIGFLLNVISPSYANTKGEKINTSINSPNSNDDIFAVSSDGYLYVFSSKRHLYEWASGLKKDDGNPKYKWEGNELMNYVEDEIVGSIKCFAGIKRKLP